MKKLFSMFILTLCLVASVSGATDKLYQTLSTYYRIYSNISEEYTKEIADKMEACLKLCNEIFHFDLTRLTVKLRVVIYADQASFNAYLQKLINQTRTDFVYIHYSDLVKSELVGYYKDDEQVFNALLIHQGLIQLLKAFVPSAPIWLQEGIAAYIETSSYDKEKKIFILEKNLAWLDTLKAIIRGEGDDPYIAINDLIIIDKQTAIAKINTFYPEAWGLVYFLLNSPDKQYNRMLWDSIRILKPALTLKENSVLIKDEVFGWANVKTLESDFVQFIQSLKTFQDYIEDGINFYNNNDLVKAKNSFDSARDIRPSDYFAYYYLGLIEYANKDYYTAEKHYLDALSRGADPALTNYALGVNAYADNEFDTARSYLDKAKNLDAEKYGQKVREILDRIEAEKIYSGEDLYVSPPDESTTPTPTSKPTPAPTIKPAPAPTTNSTPAPTPAPTPVPTDTTAPVPDDAEAS